MNEISTISITFDLVHDGFARARTHTQTHPQHAHAYVWHVVLHSAHDHCTNNREEGNCICSWHWPCKGPWGSAKSSCMEQSQVFLAAWSSLLNGPSSRSRLAYPSCPLMYLRVREATGKSTQVNKIMHHRRHNLIRVSFMNLVFLS